jgi:hypothetical protein
LLAVAVQVQVLLLQTVLAAAVVVVEYFIAQVILHQQALKL